MPLVLSGSPRAEMEKIAIDEWMAPSGSPHQFLDFRCSVRDHDYGEFYLAHCGALVDIEPMGHWIEDPGFDATAVSTNPRARMRPIHRPPRAPADRQPHCHWTASIDPDATPVTAHPSVALVERSIAAQCQGEDPGESEEPGGWDDYSGPFDADFELEDLSRAPWRSCGEGARRSPSRD